MSFSYPPTTLRETFGAKLRRLARIASEGNALTRPPLVAPTAWQPNQAYKIGDVVANAGSFYVCSNPGTSTSSVGPAVTTNGQAINDNTVAWTYYGGPGQASGGDVPTMTTVTIDPKFTGLPNTYTASTQPTAFRVYNGFAAPYRTTAWQIFSYNNFTGSTVGRDGAVEFMTDAAKFAIAVFGNMGSYRVIIDGQYYSISGVDYGSADTWIIFDFSASGGRKIRRVRFEGNHSFTLFDEVNVTATDTVWAPPAIDDVRAVWLSDSLMAGSLYGPHLPGGTVPNRVGKLLGWTDNWAFTMGSTGYIATASGAGYTYGQRIPEALTRNPDIWLFMGSTNDIGQTSAAITAAALACFQSIRAGGSTAPIVVLGVWPINNAGVAVNEAAVQAAVTQFADPLGKAFFIPIYGDPLEPWVAGAWNNSGHGTAANATMYICNDGIHPADIGTAYLSQRIADAIRANVLTKLD